MESKLIFTTEASGAVERIIEELKPEKIAVIADSNTACLCLPRVKALKDLPVIVNEAGEGHKNLETVQTVWERMLALGLKRNDLVINIGGGVVTDLGGFCAATFKRGVNFTNIPTTLLADVDASFGGKTGFDFGGVKNLIGVFANPWKTIISPEFLDTLPEQEIKSGLGEMLKHVLLGGRAENLVQFETIADRGFLSLAPEERLAMIEASVEVKKRIVESDPFEKGPRKALNLGHTAGHAIEALMLEKGSPVPHGYAVGWGLVVALVMSRLRFGSLSLCKENGNRHHIGGESDLLYYTLSLVRNIFGTPSVDCKDFDRLMQLMASDKKNIRQGEVSFTLLSALGEPQIDCRVMEKDIREAMEIACDLLGS